MAQGVEGGGAGFRVRVGRGGICLATVFGQGGGCWPRTTVCQGRGIRRGLRPCTAFEERVRTRVTGEA